MARSAAASRPNKAVAQNGSNRNKKGDKKPVTETTQAPETAEVTQATETQTEVQPAVPGVEGESYENVPIGRIKLDFNIRVNADPVKFQEGLEALAEDIMHNGLRQALILERADDGSDDLILRGGHRRFAAIQIANEKHGANIQTVKAIIHDRLTPKDRLRVMAADRHSEPLSPLALAELAKRLMSPPISMTQTEVSREFGVSVAYAGDLRRLADAPESIKDAIRKGVVSATLATDLLKTEGAERAEYLITAAWKEVESEQESAPAPAAPQTQGDTGPKRGHSRRQVTRQNIRRVQAREAGDGGNGQPRTRRTPPPSATKGPQVISPMELISRFVDAADLILACHKRGQPMGKALANLAWLVRECAINDLMSRGLSGINADTSDEEIAAFDNTPPEAAA